MERDSWDPIAEGDPEDAETPTGEREAEEELLEAEEPGGPKAVERRAEERGGEAKRVPPGRLEPS